MADETRNIAVKVNDVVEKAMLEGMEVDKEELIPVALQLNFLALNSAIEVSRMGDRGKPAAVCADEIRELAYEIVCLFDEEAANQRKQMVSPWPANPLTTTANHGEYLLFSMGGIPFVETLVNVEEVIDGVERSGDSIALRSRRLPVIDCLPLLGKPREETPYIMIHTPWAAENKLYAVAAQAMGLFFCPIGKPIETSADMPLRNYVRECWENENGEPFYFLDWTKLAAL